MTPNRNPGEFKVVSLDGQTVQVEVEPNRTVDEMANIVVRKAALSWPQGWRRKTTH
jgi:hypothetical protein